MAFNSAWYLVHTKPRQESTAKQHLERQGYTVYLPLLEHSKRQSGKRIMIHNPLFPRYLFLQMTSGVDDWGPIRSTRGVSSLVRFGLEPAKVPNTLIAEIKARAGSDGYHHEEAANYTPGEKIHIMEGPFEGYDAIFQAKRSEDRVHVLLEMVGMAARVEVPTESIIKKG